MDFKLLFSLFFVLTDDIKHSWDYICGLRVILVQSKKSVPDRDLC